MNLPGFTAEESLYRTSGHYQTARAHDWSHGAVRPAQLGGSGPVRSSQRFKKACLMGTSCVPDPNYPYCQKCTFTDETCTEVFTWYACDFRLLGVKTPDKIPTRIPKPRGEFDTRPLRKQPRAIRSQRAGGGKIMRVATKSWQTARRSVP